MKKIIITGGKGFLGSRFAKMWNNKYEIKALGSKDLDVTNEDAVMKYILEEKPDYVIHAAGIPNQQFCIDNSEKARAVNVDGALYVAKACKKVGAKMVFTSTEQLFDGSEEEGPYKEVDTAVPKAVYGKNKLEVEEKLPDILDEYWVVRFTWLFGLPERGCTIGVNILWDTIKAAYLNQPIKASNYEFRGMSDVNEICINLEKLLSLPYGTYNFGSVNYDSRYEIVRFILEEIGLEKNRIEELLIEDNSKYSKESIRELRLDTTKLQSEGIVFSPTKEAIHNCLKEFGIIH